MNSDKKLKYRDDDIRKQKSKKQRKQHKTEKENIIASLSLINTSKAAYINYSGHHIKKLELSYRKGEKKIKSVCGCSNSIISQHTNWKLKKTKPQVVSSSARIPKKNLEEQSDFHQKEGINTSTY